MKLTSKVFAAQTDVAAAKNVGASATRTRVGLSTDVQGADMQALQKFNETLPPQSAKSKRLSGRKLTPEEALAEGETLVDAPELLVAQAEAAASAATAEAAGTAAAGEAAGAAAAGEAAGAGAAAAVGGVSPLAFSPLLGAAGGGGGGGVFINTPPTLALAQKGTLSVNAPDTADLNAGSLASDVNPGQVLSYHFWVEGKAVSSVAAPNGGTYSIDRSTGVISFIADKDSLARLCQEDVLRVVAFDGFAYSEPQTFTVDRTIDFAGQDGNISTNPFELNAYDKYPDSDDHLGGITTRGPGLDLLNMSDGAIYPALLEENSPQVIPELEFDELGFSRSIIKDGEAALEGNDLLITFKVDNGSAEYGKIRFVDHFAQTGEESRLEYVHFEKGAYFHGYNLGEADQDEALVDEDGKRFYIADIPNDTTPFPEDGVYEVSRSLVGTECKDLIASSGIGGSELMGHGGNDLLFANGKHDTVGGGAGDDLIVLDSECETQTVSFSAAELGVDWVVNFGKEDVMDFGLGKSFEGDFSKVISDIDSYSLSLSDGNESLTFLFVQEGENTLLYNAVNGDVNNDAELVLMAHFSDLQASSLCSDNFAASFIA